MNKKMMKILSVLLIVVAVVSFTTIVFADEVTPASIGQKATTSDTNTEQVQNIGADIIRVISVIGIIASVVILMILGIKYMMGSAEEKAEYKKTMLPYLIGAVLLFAASGIAQVLYSTFNGWQA